MAPSVHEERLPSRRRLLVEALAQAVAQERHERRHVARRADGRGIEWFHERAERRVGVVGLVGLLQQSPRGVGVAMQEGLCDGR